MESIKKNFIYNIVYQVLLIFLPLITAPYISRTLGATAVGIYSYTNSVAYYFLMLAMLGISNYGNRSVAAVRDNKESLNRVFSSIYILQVSTFIIAILAYIIYAIFFAKNNELIFLIQLLYVISGMFDITWLFFGLEKFKLTIGRNLLIKIGTIICMFIFVHTPADLWKYTLIMSAGTFFSQVYLWIYVKKEVKFVRVSINEVLKNIKPVLVLFIPVLAYSIYKVMDKIMLGDMRTSIKLVTILCSAIAFGLMGIAPVLAPVYLGNEFVDCAQIITLLSISVFFIAWANVVRTQYLIPNRYDNIYVISTIVGAVLNFLINYMLIPHYQSNGAAIGTVVAEFSVMIIQVIAVRRELPIIRYIVKYVPIMGIGIGMMAIVREIGSIMGCYIKTLVVQVAAGGVFFCLLTVIYLFITKDEMLMLIKKSLLEK